MQANRLTLSAPNFGRNLLSTLVLAHLSYPQDELY